MVMIVSHIVLIMYCIYDQLVSEEGGVRGGKGGAKEGVECKQGSISSKT